MSELAPTAETSIEALRLSKVYWDGDRKLEIFKDVSLSVGRGEGVAILGPSGSGKTTLLNLLSGLDRPSSGEVRIGGVNLATLKDRQAAALRNRSIGFVFQFYHLLPEFSALENVMLPALLGAGPAEKRRIRARAEDLLERVGLRDRRSHVPSELSGGEQQRVAIARALVNAPEVVLCDEPTGNLDPETAGGIAQMLRKLHREEGRTLLVVTHDERLAKMTDRVWSLVTRRWQESGPVARTVSEKGKFDES